LTDVEAARLAELDRKIEEADRVMADRFDQLAVGGPADRLDASLNRLEGYLKTLQKERSH
jgi:uncharacterized protein involved in exopolysaccharide biosynthesis